MINTKEKIYFTIKLLLSLVAFLTLILFFYAAFFYDPKLVEEAVVKNDNLVEAEIKDKTICHDTMYDRDKTWPKESLDRIK